MSLSASLGIGTRGLMASQTALDIVGQNVTNANTEGYTRKRLNLESTSRRDGQFGEMGFGVDMADVQAIRDQLLDRQIQAITTDVGGAEITDRILKRIEDIVSEPGDTSLTTAMNEFWDSWQDLANDPADMTARQAVVDASLSMVGRFNTLASSLATLRSDANEEIASDVGEVNQLLTDIASLNTIIAASETREGMNANDSRDARELKLKELSKYIDISHVEDRLGRYLISSGGSLLVSAEGATSLQIDRTTVTLPDGTNYAQVGLRVASTRKDLEPSGGAIRSLMDGRDDIIPRYQQAIDDIASALVGAVNRLHETGYDLEGRTGSTFFDPRFDRASNIALNPDLERNPSRIAAGTGGASLGPGAALLLAVPAAGTSLDLTLSNPAYRNLVDGSVVVTTVGPPAVTLAEGAGKDYVVDPVNGEIVFNNYAQYGAGTAVTVDFRYNRAGPAGTGDGSNALRIGQLRQGVLADGGTSTLANSWAATVGGLGAETSRATSGLETLNQLKTSLHEQAQSLSGVSLDEELADMVRFQNSYQASARFISTVSELYDTLIGM
jgi:flagellar hook-associated protein 1 FlgK